MQTTLDRWHVDHSAYRKAQSYLLGRHRGGFKEPTHSREALVNQRANYRFQRFTSE